MSSVTPIELDYSTSALVLVDLQNGVVGMPLAPLTGEQVVRSANDLAKRFRDAGAPVVLVTLAYPNPADAPVTDAPMPPLPAAMPTGWNEISSGFTTDDSDLRVEKQGWGAFVGTDLDEKLRERGVTTLVVGGIATNFGVEETGRQAISRGYSVVFASDVTTSVSPQHYEFAVTSILPMIGRVRTAAELV